MSQQLNDQTEPTTAQAEVSKFAYAYFRDAEVPESTEVISRKGWVKWGPDNLYPQFLWYLFYCSPIHQGVISSKVDYIVSGGLKFEGDETEWTKVYNNGLSEYDLDEVAEMLCLDNEVANCYYIICKKDPLSKEWYLEPMEFELIRPDEAGVEFYYSENWSTEAQSLDKTSYRSIKSFFHRDMENDTELLLCVKTKSRQRKTADQKSKIKLTGGFFSVPGYSGGIDSIMTDIEINFFRYAEVVNGYKGGSILYLANGEPASEPAKEKVLRDLKVNVTDRRKQGGMGVVFGLGSDGKPEIVQMSGNDLDKRYESTEDGLLNKMMIAHSVTNQKLFGVMAKSTLSESDDQVSYERFQKNYANKRRKSIAGSLNFALKKLNGMKGTIEFNIPSLDLETEADEQSEFIAKLNSIPQSVITISLSVLTINEKRKKFWNAAPIPGGDQTESAPAFIAMRAKNGEDPVLIGFESIGQPRASFKIINSRPHVSFDANDEIEFIESFFKEKFESSLTELQANVLRLISEGKKSKDIQDELHLDVKQLSKAKSVLDKLGYTDGWDLTDKGQVEVIDVESVEVVYTYETRPDAPPLKGESRPFCVQLLRLDRVYTRAEIDSISAAVDRNVWLYRGGWYHDPDQDRNQPSCRHYWLQNLIVKQN